MQEGFVHAPQEFIHIYEGVAATMSIEELADFLMEKSKNKFADPEHIAKELKAPPKVLTAYQKL